MKTGKTTDSTPAPSQSSVPQWSPIMKTGKTRPQVRHLGRRILAAMEPDHEDREDNCATSGSSTAALAAMEPDHEDREDTMSTGVVAVPRTAAMEPDHEDREDLVVASPVHARPPEPQWSPIMKTGKTGGDRERRPRHSRRNGARS